MFDAAKLLYQGAVILTGWSTKRPRTLLARQLLTAAHAIAPYAYGGTATDPTTGKVTGRAVITGDSYGHVAACALRAAEPFARMALLSGGIDEMLRQADSTGQDRTPADDPQFEKALAAALAAADDLAAEHNLGDTD